MEELLRRTIDKRSLLQALRQRLEEKLDALTASHQQAQSGAFHAENRQENPKDTRAIEGAYLARGLAERVETLRDAVGALAVLRLVDFGPAAAIGLGALVGLQDDDGKEQIYFLVPAGGGEKLLVGRKTIQSLTPSAPLGSMLVGKCAADDVEVPLPKGVLRGSIAWVR